MLYIFNLSEIIINVYKISIFLRKVNKSASWRNYAARYLKMLVVHMEHNVVLLHPKLKKKEQ